MISPFLTQRTKSKFVFAGPTKTAETLFKLVVSTRFSQEFYWYRVPFSIIHAIGVSLRVRYIAPEQVPVQYGGLSKAGEQEFTTADAATEETIKPTSKHTIELPIAEVKNPTLILAFILVFNYL